VRPECADTGQRSPGIALLALAGWALVPFLHAGCGPFSFSPPPSDLADMPRRALQVGGKSRAYRTFVPPAVAGAQAGERFPAILAFHGTGGSAAQMAALTGFNALAERGRFVVVYPEGLNGQWNDGRPGINADVDDVAFVRALVDELVQQYPVDRNRICATGISNGGHFCNRLAFDARDRIAAIAPIAAALSTTLAARADAPAPTPILMILGTADPIAPYKGGAIGLTPFFRRGEMISAAEAAAYWVAANGLTSTPDISSEPDADPLDGTTVRQATYDDPAADAGGSALAPVILLTVDGGGHTWPGGPQYLPEFVVGRTSRDVSASEMIWDFFQAQIGP
jgi:polyhydroxybutyrate depolymerase